MVTEVTRDATYNDKINGIILYGESTVDGTLVRIKVNPVTGGIISDTEVTANIDPSTLATSAKQDLLVAATITEFNVALTVVDTEYHADLPANCKGIEFVSRGGYPVRYAFTTGKVATPTGVYFTLKSNCSYDSPTTLNLSSKIIYFASDNAGDVVELIAWS